ncbi:MAG: ferrous iron transport protein B [Endomicrobiales bacterium]|nr:ferrous iron transport protein B [Endomicrobiales bacterium]
MDKTIILIGNPNVGKSVIFNRLTGNHAVVSNYPGTTVDLARGISVFGGVKHQVIDTPGTISLLPTSEDEQVTRDVLVREKADVIVQVGDAKNLRRTLLLTMELLEFGLPMVLALNMDDEALERGIKTDARKLRDILGIPVVRTVAVTGEGMGELKKRVAEASPGSLTLRYRAEIEKAVSEIEGILPKETAYKRALSLMLLSQDASSQRYVDERLRAVLRKKLKEYVLKFSNHPRFLIFTARNNRANEILGGVMSVKAAAKPSRLEKLGDAVLKPFPGYLIALFMLFVMYEFVGVFGAGFLVDLLEKKLFGACVNPLLVKLADRAVPFTFVREMFVGEYGMLTMALTYALAIVLPIVATFFVFFGFLEDSGYLPRLSAMLNRVFSKVGLNGKAVLPMVLGLGCGTMAVLGARVLETRKERLMVTLLLSLAVPCSAQLGVILGLVSGLSWKVAVLWVFSLTLSLYVVGSAADRLIKGARSPFVFEIPPLRYPSLANILTKVRVRMVWYLKEAVPLFILGTFILFILDKTRMLGRIEAALSPLITGVLGLPVEATKSFVMGFLRRDYGVAGLFVLAREGMLDPRQVLVSAVAITLFIPCVAQFFMVIKEQGLKAACLIFVFALCYAFAFAGVLNLVVIRFGIM